MEKIEYKAYIKTRSLHGISATEISNELEQVHGEQAPKYRTLAKWVALYKEGRDSFEDDPRSGRPITVHTKANIELLHAIIEENPHTTFDILEEEKSINRLT